MMAKLPPPPKGMIDAEMIEQQQWLLKMAKLNENASALIPVYIDPKIVEAIHPELTYPKWIKRCIKRRYGKHPAIYLDIWKPYPPSLFELLPRRPRHKVEFDMIPVSRDPDIIVP